MRHRIGGGVAGLGNPCKELLSNTGELTPLMKKMADEAIKLYFKKWGGCDYEVGRSEGALKWVKLGIEPAYQFEDLKIIVLNRHKERSFLRAGRAFEMYGGGVRSTYRFYSDCKTNAKFKKSVDRWHPGVFQLRAGNHAP